MFNNEHEYERYEVELTRVATVAKKAVGRSFSFLITSRITSGGKRRNN